MCDLPINTVFESLASTRWDVAYRTYGCSHPTLIGLLVQWWIELSPDHTALDGAPSHGKGGGKGDALFCRHQEPVGVLEAENLKPLAKVESIVKYFDTERPELKSVCFGILLQYSYKQDRQVIAPNVIEAVRQALSTRPGRTIIIIVIEKKNPRIPTGIRSTTRYKATISRVSAILFDGCGKENHRVLFAERAEPGAADKTGTPNEALHQTGPA
jgi:hypothetical protein